MGRIFTQAEILYPQGFQSLETGGLSPLFRVWRISSRGRDRGADGAAIHSRANAGVVE